jgi:uncharacterized OsmC-like protein
MTKIQGKYLGQLRTQSIHLPSGDELLTDAPTDNHGKGETFSPTDLVATALGSCMVTIMGIYAAGRDIDLSGTYWETEKVMASNPRRIAAIRIRLHLPQSIAASERPKLEHAARNCPVALSLSTDLEQDIQFFYDVE